MTILVLSVSFIYLHFYFEIILDLPKSCRKKRERERETFRIPFTQLLLIFLITRCITIVYYQNQEINIVTTLLTELQLLFEFLQSFPECPFSIEESTQDPTSHLIVSLVCSSL